MDQKTEEIPTLDKKILEEVKFYTKESFPDVIASFMESYVSHIKIIEQVLHENKNMDISASAHALKSIGGQIGAIKFSSIAKNLEYESQDESDHEPDKEKMKQLYKSLNHEAEDVIKLLEEELEQDRNA